MKHLTVFRPLAVVSLALLLSVLTLTSPTFAERPVVAPPEAVLDLPFSPAVWNGDFLMLSGAIANEPGTTNVSGDASAQTLKTLENLRTVLKAAGLDTSDVVDTNVYLSDARHFAAFNKVYQQEVQAPRPTRTTVAADIAIPGSLTEISMIAVRRGVERRAITPEGWPVHPSFSWGWLVGDTLLISGLVSNDPTTGKVLLGEPKAQIKKTMENIGKVLEAADMGYDNLVSCRVYLDDARSFQALNEVYPTFFEQAPPARATVRAKMANPDLAVEIQCTAVKGERRAVLPPGAKPRPTLSPAIANGDRLFLSGMVGRKDGKFPSDVSEQTQAVLDNLEATLKAAGMTFDDVTDATVYLTDIRHYAEMNAVYGAALKKPAPARATVGMVLMSPDALVEIQMHARRQKIN